MLKKMRFFFLCFGLLSFGFAIASSASEVLAITFVVSSQAASRIGDPALWAARCVEPAHSMVAAIVCVNNWLIISNQTANTSLPFSANCTLALVQSPDTDANVVIALLMQGARFNDTAAANRSATIMPLLYNNNATADKPFAVVLSLWHIILLIIAGCIWAVWGILVFVYYCICPRCCPLQNNDNNNEEEEEENRPIMHRQHAYQST